MEDLTETPRAELACALDALEASLSAVPNEASPYAVAAKQPPVAGVALDDVHVRLVRSICESSAALAALHELPPTASLPHVRSAIEATVMLRYLVEEPSELYERFLVLLDADWRKQRSMKSSPFGDAYEHVTGRLPPDRYWTHSAQLKRWSSNDADTRVARELAATWMLLSAYQHGSVLTGIEGDAEVWGSVQQDVDLGTSIWHLAEMVALCSRSMEATKASSGSF